MNNLEEKFLYDLMATLYKMNAPIVFKGALVLKVIQYNCSISSGLERETHDIDGDWVGDKPSMTFLTTLLQTAVNKMGYPVRVEPYREYGVRKSAGFNFVRCDNNEIFTTMDLSIKSNDCVYKYSYINGITFYGQSINKIIVDKLHVCTTRLIFRRVKDIIDLYILSFCWGGCSKDLVDLARVIGKPIDDFDRLTLCYKDLEHAYNKYKNKASVLPFNVVYDRVLEFLAPFISGADGNYYWDRCKWNKVR